MTHYDVVLFTDMNSSFWHAKPMGAYRVASELRKHGYTATVIDFFGEWLADPKLFNQLLNLVVSEKTLFLGFSSVFFTDAQSQTPEITCYEDIKQYVSAPWPLHVNRMELYFSLIRKKFPTVKLVYGGVHEGHSVDKRVADYVDFVIKGLADTTIIELANHLSRQTPLKYMPSDSRAKLISHDTKALSFDFPNCVVDYQPEDHIVPGEVLPLETSRGCLFKCSFCDFPLIGRKKGDPDYHKTVDVMAHEFRRNSEKYQVNKYFFVDDTFNETTAKLEEILRARDISGVDIKFECYLRADLLARFPEQILLLKELGMESTILGIESLYLPSARAIGKSTHPEKIKEVMYQLKEDDSIRIFASFIVGLPEDNPDTLSTWTDWVLDKNCPADGFRFFPLQITGMSEIAQNPESFGYTVGPNHTWSNKHWNSKQAGVYASKIMKQAWDTDRLKLAGFDFLGIQNFNFTPDQMDTILQAPMNKLDYNLLHQKRKEQWTTYKNKVLHYETVDKHK